MEGEWSFVPYTKRHDEEGGLGYFVSNFEGGEDYVEYDKTYTEDGFFITPLDGEEIFYPNPTEDEEEDELFDLDAALNEAE